MENFKLKTVEELFEEWHDSEKAISKRIETLSAFDGADLMEALPFIKSMNSERKQAFIAGYDLAIAEIIKYMEQVKN